MGRTSRPPRGAPGPDEEGIPASRLPIRVSLDPVSHIHRLAV